MSEVISDIIEAYIRLIHAIHSNRRSQRDAAREKKSRTVVSSPRDVAIIKFRRSAHMCV